MAVNRPLPRIITATPTGSRPSEDTASAASPLALGPNHVLHWLQAVASTTTKAEGDTSRLPRAAWRTIPMSPNTPTPDAASENA